MSQDRVLNALRGLIAKTLEDTSMLPFLSQETEKIVLNLERLADEVMNFFVEPDSLDSSSSKVALTKNCDPEESIERAFTIYSINEVENAAADDAERGDFRALEKLVQTKGFLRTARARELVVRRMRGEKKNGSVKTTVNVDTFMSVTVLMLREKLTESAAKERWLDMNPKANPETLKKRMRLAKKEPSLRLIVELLRRQRERRKKVV